MRSGAKRALLRSTTLRRRRRLLELVRAANRTDWGAVVEAAVDTGDPAATQDAYLIAGLVEQLHERALELVADCDGAT